MPILLSEATDLGTPEIHLRKAVMIEGGQVPRARVMNQHEIDRLLMLGVLTGAQHRAGEYFLDQCARAGVFVKSINFENCGGTTNTRRDNYNGLWPYSKTLRLIRKALSMTHAILTHDVVCNDRDVTGSRIELEALTDSLQLIVDRRLTMFG